MRKPWLFFLVFCAFPGLVSAQTIDDYRGTWFSEHSADPYVLYLVVNAGLLSGTFCHDCSNPDTLGLVDDSTTAGQDLHFSVYYSPRATPASIQSVIAHLEGGALQLALSDNSGTRTLTLIRPPPPPAAPVVAAAIPVATPKPYVLPAPPEVLTEAQVTGLWLSGNGPGKQYFIFKPHKGSLRGLVCGPCDNPGSFAPLESFRLTGATVHFDIVHEDNGFGVAEHGPFRNVTSAQVVRNEMHLRTVASFEPDATPYEMTLLGPVQYMPMPQ